MPYNVAYPAGTDKISGVASIRQGGSGETSREATRNVMDLVPMESINKPGGVLGLDENGRYDQSMVSDVTIDGPLFGLRGETVDWFITNYDMTRTYQIEAINGSVSIEDSVISYTADPNATTGGFVIEGRRIEIPVLDYGSVGSVVTPSIIAPVAGSNDVSIEMNFISSDFAVTFGEDVHIASSWQLSRDPNFTQLDAFLDNDRDKLIEWNPGPLQYNITYYVRVRHIGALSGIGQWSEARMFKTADKKLPSIQVAMRRLLGSDNIITYGYNEISFDPSGNEFVIIRKYRNYISTRLTHDDCYLERFRRQDGTWPTQSTQVLSTGGGGENWGNHGFRWDRVKIVHIRNISACLFASRTEYVPLIPSGIGHRTASSVRRYSSEEGSHPFEYGSHSATFGGFSKDGLTFFEEEYNGEILPRQFKIYRRQNLNTDFVLVKTHTVAQTGIYLENYGTGGGGSASGAIISRDGRRLITYNPGGVTNGSLEAGFYLTEFSSDFLTINYTRRIELSNILESGYFSNDNQFLHVVRRMKSGNSRWLETLRFDGEKYVPLTTLPHDVVSKLLLSYAPEGNVFAFYNVAEARIEFYVMSGNEWTLKSFIYTIKPTHAGLSEDGSRLALWRRVNDGTVADGYYCIIYE